MHISLSLLFCILFSQYSLAEESSTSTVTTSTPAQVKSKSSSNILLGFKSLNQFARFGFLNNDSSSSTKGQTFSGKQEIYGGYKFENGWGGFVQFTQYRRQYNDSAMNKWVRSDTSFSLIHPTLIDAKDVKVSGLVRSYLTETDRSVAQNIRQFAYYSTQIFTLDQGREISNFTIPRWFVASFYKDADTRFYFENYTVFTQKINSSSRWGIGNWLQIEQHAATATGYADEIVPQYDYLVSSNFFFGPRLYLPILSVNAVYDGPQNATLDQARAELFMKVSL